MLAVCICAREAIKSMRERNVDDGHVFNISRWIFSVLCFRTSLSFVSYFRLASFKGHLSHVDCSMSGHRLTDKTEHFYAGNKHQVRIMTEGLRRELKEIKSHIRVTVSGSLLLYVGQSISS